MKTSDSPVSPPQGVRLTPQQAAALVRDQVSVALSAGAGCGKTLVLAERFLGEFSGDDARPLRSVVALTFTEKAARELRERIRNRCRSMLELGDPQETPRWRTILRGLEAAPIGTFHEFCGRMLRQYPAQTGIDPDFTVLDDSIARTLRDEAVRSTIRSALAQQSIELIDLAVDYGLNQIYETLTDLVASATLDDLVQWSSQAVEEVLEQWRSVWIEAGRPALIRRVAHPARRCRSLLDGFDAVSPKLQVRRAEILPLLFKVENGLASEHDLIELKDLAKISDLRGKDVWPSDDVKEQVQAAFKAIRDAVTRVVPLLNENPQLTLQEIASRQRLATLAAQASREYERVKKERHGLDFDDLQRRFVRLLLDHHELFTGDGESTDVSDSSSNRFDFILVDEFQDTDRLQSEILVRLGDDQFLNGRLFVVGDFKQSIYGFRGAEPSIFQEWRGAFPEAGRRELSENFRSVPGVIHFVNALFAECFNTTKTPSSPDELASDPILEPETLNHLGPRRDPVDSGPSVTFHWANVDRGQTSGESVPTETRKPRKPTTRELREAEAKSLARLLRERIDQGWMIYDRELKRNRLAQPGDVALLFRAMTDVGPYEAALAEQGFDYLTVGGAAFFAQQEIHDVINVLSVVEDPYDDLALAGALRSPFFSLSDDALYWLATSFDGGLAAGLLRAEEISSLPPPDRRQAVRARELLNAWREVKDRVPIAAILKRILDESGFESVVVCEFLGSRKVANIRKLVTMARGFDRQGGFLLADFVGQLRAHRDDPPREEQASTSDEEGTSVRLMSIHQSKGLEFPIVVLPDLNRASEFRGRLVAIHPKLGLVVRPSLAEAGTSSGDDDSDSNSSSADDSEAGSGASGGSLGWETCQALSREAEEEEALRLFYVATTRSRDHLILSSGYSLEQEPKSVSLRLLAERFDLASGACFARLPDDWPVPEIEVASQAVANLPDLMESRRPSSRVLSLDDIREGIASRLRDADSQGPRQTNSQSIESAASLIDLDRLDGLSPRERRVHRLIRSMIADRRLYQRTPLASIADRAASRQFPAPHSGIIREAIHWMSAWLKSDGFQGLNLQVLSADTIREDVGWTRSVRMTDESASLVQGRAEILIQTPEQGWSPLAVCLGTSKRAIAAARLRLLLSGTEVITGQIEPPRTGWLVVLNDGQSETRREERFDEESILVAMRSFLAANTSDIRED